MSDLRNNPPDFIRNDAQISYYEQIIDKLEDNGVPVKSQDSFSIGMFAVNLALIDFCVTSIMDDGATLYVEGDRGMVTKVNPCVAMQKEAQTAVRFYFKEFHMSPTSRGTKGFSPPVGGKDKTDSVLDKV